MTVLVRFLVPQGWRIALAIGLGAAVVASNMGLLAAAAYLIAAASLTHLMALLIIPMYAVRILSVTRGSGRYAERMVSHRVTFDVLARLRDWLYGRLIRLGPSGMAGSHSGDTLGRTLADVDVLQNAYLLFLTPVAVAILVTILLITLLSAFSGVIAWVTLGYLLLCGVALPAVVLLTARGPGALEVYVRAGIHTHLVDSLQGHRDIVTNDAAGRYLNRTSQLGAALAHAQTRLADVAAGREAAGELLANLAMLSAIALAVPLVSGHHVSGLYVAVPGLLTLAGFEAIRPLAQAAGTASGIVAATRRVTQLSEKEAPVDEPLRPVPLRPPYSLAFRNVTVRYGEERRPALQNVTFTVREGAQVAIVGPSGAGKSTVARLLTRAWDPSEGEVVIGAHSVREYALGDLRSTIGVVAQDTYIFSASIRSNLRLARHDASDGEMEEALDLAGLGDLMRSLPGGLDTWVGEHGQALSGGERQRLAIARVLLQRTPIVLLDEVTANLDVGTEREVLNMMGGATEGRTTVMLTHRLLDMERFDEILVLDEGRIVERGTHSRLYGACGLYRRLIDTQNNMLPI